MHYEKYIVSCSFFYVLVSDSMKVFEAGKLLVVLVCYVQVFDKTFQSLLLIDSTFSKKQAEYFMLSVLLYSFAVENKKKCNAMNKSTYLARQLLYTWLLNKNYSINYITHCFSV